MDIHIALRGKDIFILVPDGSGFLIEKPPQLAHEYDIDASVHKFRTIQNQSRTVK